MKSILFAVLLAICCSACDSDDAKALRKVSASGGLNEFSVYVVDSCEYIGLNVGINVGLFTHKGNCRFCESRHQKR